MMNSNNGKKGAASSQDWRANASPNTTTTDSWRRRDSADSGYESARSRSNSPLPSIHAWSSYRCTCHQYSDVYKTYKDRERTVRRWLCLESGRNIPDSELDDIDVGSLLKMADRLKAITVPFSVSQGLRKAIEGRKAVIERWHGEEDYACPVCPRVWRKVDESHKHHIKELERMLVILGIEKASKPKVDPTSHSTWR